MARSALESSFKLGRFCAIRNVQDLFFQKDFHSLSNGNACTKVSPLFKLALIYNIISEAIFLWWCLKRLYYDYTCASAYFQSLIPFCLINICWIAIGLFACYYVKALSLQSVKWSLKAGLSVTYHTFPAYADAVRILVRAPCPIMHQLLHVCYIVCLLRLAVQVTSLAGWRKIKVTA